MLIKERLKFFVDRLRTIIEPNSGPGENGKKQKPADSTQSKNTEPGSVSPPRFRRNDIVAKVSGKVRFWGLVKAVYNIDTPSTPEGWRYDVMAIHPDFRGLIHIYADKDLALLILSKEEAIEYGLVQKEANSERAPSSGF